MCPKNVRVCVCVIVCEQLTFTEPRGGVESVVGDAAATVTLPGVVYDRAALTVLRTS